MDIRSIIHWNVQGIDSRKYEILDLSKSFQASIIATQETFLWRNVNFKIPNFNCLRKVGQFNVRGHEGVALFIRVNIPYKEITLQPPPNSNSSGDNNKYNLHNLQHVYPPSGAIDQNLFPNLYQQLPQPFL